MADIYVLDQNLKPIAIVDAFTSVIWADRYYEQGDCELYLPATMTALSVLKKGNYLTKSDSEMVCVIEKIEVDTNSENGNYLIITGRDVKSFLDRRVVWNTISIDGNVEAAVRSMVDGALGGTAVAARKLLKQNGGRLMYLGTSQGLAEVTTEQISYKNIGEKVREYCRKYKWGYKVYENNEAFYFSLYAGRDLSNSVVFSNAYENLQSSKYVEDSSNIENVALIAGEGEGADRVRTTSGNGDYAGTGRYEVYVDAKDISKSITYEDLTAAYPNGSIINVDDIYFYIVGTLLIPILDSEQSAKLAHDYPSGSIITVDGIEYYRITNVGIARLESGSPQSNDTVILEDVIYETYLLTRGQQKLAEFGEVKSFEGEVEPNTTFVFRKDYNLGDVVTVENEYGISVKARIVEIIEVEDNNGYSVQPKFEYEEISGEVQVSRLLTEDSKGLAAENGKGLVLERSASTEDSVKISELPEAGAVTGTEFIPLVSGNANKKVAISTMLGDLNNQVSTLNGTVQGLAGDVEDLSDDVGDLSGDVSGLDGRVTGLAGDVDDLQAALAGKQDELTAGDGISILNGVISADLEVHQASVSLSSANWDTSLMTQQVTVTGLLITDVVIITPSSNSRTKYIEAGIYCSSQAANGLTFLCSTIPTNDIQVNVVYIRGAV